MKVWVLRYYSYNGRDDDEIIGIYELEEMARHDGIIEAKKNPNIRPHEVKWNGTHMVYHQKWWEGARDNWHEVRGLVLEEWDVTCGE